jgi:DNA-directed RNA polymerase specialized sigma24 family protein
MYHYVLAWTGEQATAVDLLTAVLRTAVRRMDQLVEGAGAEELEMRLMALLRAAVIKRQARPGKPPAPTAVPQESMALFEGLGQLDDTQREVLVLCGLLGQEPDRVARLLGCDREVLDGLREAASESLWRTMNDAPEDRSVSTWQRLTAGAALRQAAVGWLHPVDGSVLAYVGEQLFGEVPVGVPAAPARRGFVKALKGAPAGPPAAPAPPAEPPALPTRPGAKPVPAAPGLRHPAGKDGEKVPPAMSPGAAPGGPPESGPDRQARAAGKGRAKGNGAAATTGAAAAATGQGSQKATGATTGEQPSDQRTRSGALASLAGLRGRLGAWGIAAVGATILGVVAALTVGGPVSGAPDCPSPLSCMPSTTLAAGGRNTLPTDAAGNLVPTSSLAGGGFVPAPGFTVATASSVTTTSGPVPTTTRGTATTAPPSTAPPTTAPPSTAPPTTAPPSTAPPTTAPPSTALPTTAAGP